PCRHRDPGHPPGVLSLRAQQLAELVGGSGALPLHLGGGARLLELGGGAAPLPLRHGGSAPAARGRRHLRVPLRGGDGRLPLGPDRERRRAGGGHGVAGLAGRASFIGPRGLRPRAARWPRRMTLILSLGFILFLLANVPIALALGGAAVLALLWEGQIPLLIVPQRIFTGVTVVVAEIFFSGISGSTVADTSALGTTMIPAMRRAGYSAPRATAIVSAASGMGILVPPCINMVVYGIMAQVSIAALFAAGFLPAFLMAAILM